MHVSVSPPSFVLKRCMRETERVIYSPLFDPLSLTYPTPFSHSYPLFLFTLVFFFFFFFRQPKFLRDSPHELPFTQAEGQTTLSSETSCSYFRLAHVTKMNSPPPSPLSPFFFSSVTNKGTYTTDRVVRYMVRDKVVGWLREVHFEIRHEGVEKEKFWAKCPECISPQLSFVFY